MKLLGFFFLGSAQSFLLSRTYLSKFSKQNLAEIEGNEIKAGKYT